MIPFHPLANLFPLIEGREFDELVADVRENGVIERIVVLDGMILDGRNRYRAGIAAGVIDPDAPAHDGIGMQQWCVLYRVDDRGDPLTWVLSKNLHRRHLTENQRAMIAAEIATMRKGRPSEWNADRDDEAEEDKSANRRNIRQDEAAEMLNVSTRSVQRGRQVLDHGTPELVEAVKGDRIAVSAAAEVARLPASEQLEILRSMPSHLVAKAAKERVGNGARSVNAGRIEPVDSLDFFPTPPWATRALVEDVLRLDIDELAGLTVWEPACGEGHMSGVLEEYFGTVIATDVFDYAQDSRSAPGWRGVLDFIGADSAATDMAEGADVDWIITNPPFSGETDRALDFALKALPLARQGVALFVRTQWLEGVKRYRELFNVNPPTVIAQFAERVPLHRGRWLPDGDTQAQYCWLVWVKPEHGAPCGYEWIPPGRRELLADDGDIERFTARPVLATPEHLRATAPSGGAATTNSDPVANVGEEANGAEAVASDDPASREVDDADRQRLASSGFSGDAADAPQPGLQDSYEPATGVPAATSAAASPEAAAEGEGGLPVGAGDALPHADLPIEQLSKAQQNDIIRAGYEREPKVTAVELMVLTGLKRSTIEMRAKAMGLADPANRINAALREVERRRAATSNQETANVG